MSTALSRPVRSRRLFLAMCPDAAVRDQIDAQVRRWSWCPGSVLYAREDWHITLHFLGAVPGDRIPAIEAGADLAMTPFQWALDQPHLWPGGVAVLCPSKTPPPLRSLHERLGFLLLDLNQAVDPRPYRPHLTLARHAGSARPPDRFEPVVWSVHSYALVASTGHTHPRYEILRHYGRRAPTD
jgi:RNA 2',3'-cyclic 3'-phosphodiesterase